MGFSFRKSKSLGAGFKLNLSKNSGIGISGGIKGLRLSVNQKEARFSASKNGLYYRKTKSLNTKTKNDVLTDEELTDDITSNLEPKKKIFYSKYCFIVSAVLFALMIIFSMTNHNTLSTLSLLSFCVSLLIFVIVLFVDLAF